jgi:hypothetical protein
MRDISLAPRFSEVLTNQMGEETTVSTVSIEKPLKRLQDSRVVCVVTSLKRGANEMLNRAQHHRFRKLLKVKKAGQVPPLNISF